jgi:uncharacterized protein (DUF1778 family)
MLAKAPINMRVLPAQKTLISKAAEMLNMDRTTFILNAACREAENVLLDQRLFQLNPDEFDAFESALTAPPKPNAQLKKLFLESSPWTA